MNVRCLGCRALGEWGRSGRCPACLRAHSNARDAQPDRRAYKARRYDSTHRKARAALAELIQAQGGYTCARGGEWVNGVQFDADHIDGTWKASCPRHNRANRPKV